ncbi:MULTISPECIES: lipid II flippase Amj family protein [Ahrensia]|uniref:Lipid II flippase Amj n=1 Tax=Ahrensia kielensis TaxID=76980 RepID=A0ABU9T8F7_9HYPH|nr:MULTISPECIES: lipid II flippase Amj family protein [Ahrensia]
MDVQLLAILFLTFIIHLIGTLAYGFRIAGVRSRQIAIAFSIFNVMVLVSRISNSFQGPLLAKRVENTINAHAVHNLLNDFMLILLAASAATIIGGLLIPTVQRFGSVAVESFRKNRSMPALIIRLATPRGISAITSSVALPRWQNITQLSIKSEFPAKIIILNVLATALWTVGVLASIYAGYLEPEFRVTASSLSAVINGLATIMMFILIDPYLAGLTDDVAGGKVSENYYRKFIIWMVLSRLAGTILAQLLLVPSAQLIAWLGRII